MDGLWIALHSGKSREAVVQITAQPSLPNTEGIERGQLPPSGDRMPTWSTSRQFDRDVEAALFGFALREASTALRDGGIRCR